MARICKKDQDTTNMAELPIFTTTRGRKRAHRDIYGGHTPKSHQPIQGTPISSMPDAHTDFLFLLTCIKEIHNSIHMKAPWTMFLEGRQGLCWNLQLAPSPKIIMGLFARLMFISSHFMHTFEDAFYTGFFEYKSHIFGPLVH